MDYKDTRLEDVVEDIKDQFNDKKMKLFIFLDTKGGVSRNRTLTYKAKDEPLEKIFDDMFKKLGLTLDKLSLARPDAIVMHPGPMNRGVEIDSSVADGPHSVILPQVTFGIAVRMAVMSIVAGN